MITPKRIGIVAVNHTGYVEAVFSNMETGTIVVPLRNAEDHYRIQAAHVDEIITPQPGDRWLNRSFNSPASDELALIAFTSGTESNPKGVMLTHNNLNDVIIRLNTLMQVDDSIREYIGVPVYHSFGLGRCRAVAAVGGHFFVPDHFNPAQIGEMLKKGTINAISAVPSLWRILLANKDLIGDSGKRVQWIEIGSQYMSQSEKESLKTLFPNARIVQHYGLTEASRTTLLEIHREEGEKLESVGRALGKVEIKLTAEQHIAIRGPHVATGYLIEGKTVRLQDENGWFITKDLGKLTDDYLYYQGRADDIINCGGLKVSPEALETRVYAELQIEGGVVICRKPDPIRGEGFLVAVMKDIQLDKQQLHETVLRATQELGVNAANAISIVEVESLPKTASGKIQRRKISQQYGEVTGIKTDVMKMSTAENYIAPTTPEEKMLCDLAQEILKVDKVSVTDSFLILGVDSLLSLKLMFQLKSKGLTDNLIKEILSGRTIREVATKISSKNEQSTPITAKEQILILNTTEAINAVRGIAIILIVFNHWIGGLLNKIFNPALASPLTDILRYPGTPLFALAFGLFLSYLYADFFQKENFSNVFKFIQSRALILLFCILLMSLSDYIRMFVTGDFSSTAFAKAIYSIMNYYFLATLTIPFLLYLLPSKSKRTIEMSVVLATISMSVAVYLRNFAGWTPWQDGWMLLIKLNLLGYYGYFNLLAFSLLGVAVGIALKNFKDERQLIYTMPVISLMACLIGIFLGGHNYSVEGFRLLFPQLFFHTGIALLIILSMLLIHHVEFYKGRSLLAIRSVLGTVGIMTLPIYILHGYVIPLERMFMYFGVPKFIALMVPLIVFFFIIISLAKIVHKTKAST